MSEAVILYDADCGFCRWAVDKLLVWDRAGKLRPTALQGPEADRLLPRAEQRGENGILAPRGRRKPSTLAAPLRRRSSASFPAAGRLPPSVAAFPGLSDRAYRLVARNRDRFGRLAGTRCEVDPGRRRAAPVADRDGEEREA